MTDWAPLEVAIGLVLVYFILNGLERWLANILKDPPSRQQVRRAVAVETAVGPRGRRAARGS
jgi:hypothetical protein